VSSYEEVTGPGRDNIKDFQLDKLPLGGPRRRMKVQGLKSG